MSGAGLFKARFSYDYLQIEPIVLKYLEDNHHPVLAVSSEIEAYVRAANPSHWIEDNRLKHCISRALRLVGYEKRSKRGKAWEMISGWFIRQADVRKKNANPAWKRVSPQSDADFMRVDTHTVRSGKKTVVHHTGDCIKSLSTFFPVY